MAGYYSIIAKAVSALDLNTERARQRLYERARAALRSEMHGAYPPFRRSEIAAAEMSLETAIEAVREEKAKLATLPTSPLRASVSVTPSPPANQNGGVRRSLAILWARYADKRGPGRADTMSDHSKDGADSGRRTWLTELLARASHGVDHDEQNFTPRWTPTQNG
jgi:hypothetical protein